MKKFLLSGVIIFFGIFANAQLTMPTQGGSVRATVTERIGITDVTINYGRPAVNGRNGKIWGDLVYKGFQKQGYGKGNDCPWRAGANENTTIEFSTDVMIEGHLLPAGKYGFFIAYDPNSSTLIFSHNNSAWGSYFYDQKEDALRVNVKPVSIAESQERLVYEFSKETDSSVRISLIWEKLAIPFTVSTQLQKLQLASFERELQGDKGFDPHNLEQVAEYYNDHDIKLDEALNYISGVAETMPSFSALMTKGEILVKLHQPAKADSVIEQAMNMGSAMDLHTYARQLLREKKAQKAFDVFKRNYDRHPDTYTTDMGMARGYSGLGKLKEALKYANKALPLAPDPNNRKAAEGVVETLKQGKELEVM